MADDIFDYFGGNSSRKVEPLDENEMFDDLLPKKDEKAEAEVEEVDEPEIVEAELVSVGEDQNESTSVENEPAGESNDPWNSLASSLGLEPPAPPVVKAESSPDKSAESKREREPKADRTSGKRRSKPKREAVAGDAEADVISFEKSSEPTPADVLSDMFESAPAADDSRADSDVGDADDDPFAAFSGSGKASVLRETEEVEIESEPTPVAEVVDVDDDSDDFIEFEVKDLTGRGEATRDRRPPRRRRGGRDDQQNRSSERRPTTNRSRDDREEETQRSQSSDRNDAGDGGRRKRRGRSQDDEATTERDSSRQEQSRQRTSRDRNRGRDNVGHDREDDDRRDKRKKANVPTWQEAISVVVDANIKRHESGSKSGGRGGRGGRRRRRD